MAIEIRETKISPDAAGDTVQLYISDAAQEDESGTFVLRISARLPPMDTPLVGHVQREAMKAAQEALTTLLSKMAGEITSAGHGLDPRPKK